MKRESAYRQYLNEVSTFEKYGSLNVISFEDWLSIKGIVIDETRDEIKWVNSIKDNIPNKIEEKELKIYRELLGHTSQDIDTLED